MNYITVLIIYYATTIFFLSSNTNIFSRKTTTIHNLQRHSLAKGAHKLTGKDLRRYIEKNDERHCDKNGFLVAWAGRKDKTRRPAGAWPGRPSAPSSG